MQNINTHAPKTSKKSVIEFLEQRLSEFKLKMDIANPLDNTWVSILEDAISYLKQSKKRVLKCYLNTASIRVAIQKLKTDEQRF